METNDTFPASVLAKGEDATLRFICHGTEMGAFLRQSFMAELLAEEELLDEVREFLDYPAFVENEERLVSEWQVARSQAATRLIAAAENDLAAFAPFDTDAKKARLVLRVAAYRRLDVLWQGRQTFIPAPELGGDPYFLISLPGHRDPLPIGRVSGAIYDPDPKLDALALEFCLSEGRVAIVENSLEPLLGDYAGPEGWETLHQLRRYLEPAASWDRSNALPALLQNVVLHHNALPAGVIMRPVVRDTIAEMGGDGILPVIQWLGISPYIVESLLPYLDAQKPRVAQLAADSGLVLRFVRKCPALRELASNAIEQAMQAAV